MYDGNTISAPAGRPHRSVWRFCLAVLAVAANLTLPSAIAQATQAATVAGASFSLCLASGNNSAGEPGNSLPEGPAVSAVHCSLCLFSAGFTGMIGAAITFTIPVDYPVVLSYAYDEPALAPQRDAQKFDARAPPA